MLITLTSPLADYRFRSRSVGPGLYHGDRGHGSNGLRQVRHATVDFDEISWLRKHSPGWKLLCADNAPLILSFFEKVFVEENIRSISAADLASRLDDELYALNERPGGPAFPKPAKAYLADWADRKRTRLNS